MESGELRKIVARIAGEAAGLLRDMWGTAEASKPVDEARNTDTVLADWDAEGLILELLRSEGLGGVMVTEERGVVEIGGGGLVFIVDPLDGSKNYLAGIPWCSVSIAVADPSRGRGVSAIVAGAVAPIFQGPVYSFDRETGCWEGGSRADKPEKPFPAVLAYFEDFAGALAVRNYREITGHTGPVRSLGSAALEIIYTALGRAEAFIDARAKLRSVDVAAPLGFAETCGSRFSDASGGEPEIGFDRITRIRSLVVGFDEEYWRKALEAVRRAV